MEKINNIYLEVKNYKELKKKRDYKLEHIKSLEKELYQHFELRNTIISEMSKITELQHKLKNLEDQIETLSIKNKKITNITDIFKIEDKNLLRIKSIEFIDELIYDWADNDNKVIVLSKNTVKFFKRMKSETFYKELKNKYYKRLCKYFQGVLYTDITYDETETEYYLNIIDDIRKEYDIDKFYNNNKEICNFLFEVLSENLSNKMNDMIKNRNNTFMDVLKNNNRIIKNTKYHIKNEIEYIDRIILNVIDYYCVHQRKNIKIDLDNKDYNFSEEFATLLFCFNNISDKNRVRTFKSLILDFFNIEKIDHDIFNYVCVFGEIDYLIKNYNFSFLVSKKEELFCEIIKISGVTNINLRDEVDTIKNDIYQNQYSFKEMIDMFLNDNLRLSFTISYFDSLCNYLIDFILNRVSISIRESESWIDLISFVLELCGIESMLNNGCRIKCIECILSSNMKEIEDLILNEKICLEKSEIINLIIALFNDSQRRTELISKIKG